MTDLANLLALGHDTLFAAFLAFLRIGSAMALLPAFGERLVPNRLRLFLALAFTVIVFPALLPQLKAALARPHAFPALWISEPLAGLCLGFALRLTVMVLQIAGTIAAQSTSLSQVFASAGAEPVAAIGQLLVLGGLALAVTLGLHLEIAETLIDSYRSFPPGDYPAAGELLGWATQRIGASFSLAFAFAMPFVIGALIYNVALGVINKAMPQLMVAMVGAPALTLGGMLLLMLTAPVILSVWIRQLGDVLANPF
jgi:flagellar biosynthesis protein FliR